MRRTAAIVTARLHIRPYRPDDLDVLYRLWTDPAVRRHLWDDEIIPRRIAAEVLQASIDSTRAHGFGHWALCAPDDPAVIGFCGFRHVEDGSDIELLYGLAPSLWHRGLATEAGRAMLRWGFDQHHFARVLGITDIANAASIRVLERVGMRFLERRQLHGRDSMMFAVAAEDLPGNLEPARVHFEEGQS